MLVSTGRTEPTGVIILLWRGPIREEAQEGLLRACWGNVCQPQSHYGDVVFTMIPVLVTMTAEAPAFLSLSPKPDDTRTS